MPCQNVVDINEYSFSLSGLADRHLIEAPPSPHYVPNMFYMLRMDDARVRGMAPDLVRINKFVPSVGRFQLSFLNRLVDISRFYTFSHR